MLVNGVPQSAEKIYSPKQEIVLLIAGLLDLARASASRRKAARQFSADAGVNARRFRYAKGAAAALLWACLVPAFGPAPLRAQQIAFSLKSAPPDLIVSLNGAALMPVSAGGGIRSYRLDGSGGTLRFSAPACRSVEYPAAALPLKDGLVQIKLEKENGALELLAEYPTGRQPKSAYFSPRGERLFVPLLDQPGLDVFRFTGDASPALVFEKRLAVPGSGAVGFVEALCDARRGELLVSNMVENKVHIFDLATLAHKQSLATGGVLPKVIAQSPAGDITAVSNWVSRDISIFNTETKALLHRIPAGGTPRGMAFSPNGGLLYAAIYDRP